MTCIVLSLYQPLMYSTWPWWPNILSYAQALMIKEIENMYACDFSIFESIFLLFLNNAKFTNVKIYNIIAIVCLLLIAIVILNVELMLENS